MKACKWLVSSALCLSAVLPSAHLPLQAQETADGIFPVLEDAYVRKDRASNTGDFENITKAHGSQYEGKGLKVLNAKENGGTRIIPMMKFQIPSAAQLEENDWNQVELVFHVFKNADPANCPQTYHFYWTEDTDWSESTVTWSTKPASVDKDAENWLFDLTFDKNDAWEFKPEEDKIVRADISRTVAELAAEGVNEITIFAAAESSKNTSLMFHSRESSLSSSYLEASHQDYSREKLASLAEEAAGLEASSWTADSWQQLCTALEAARQVLSQENPQADDLKQAILDLQAAMAGLSKAEDPQDPDNLAYAKPVRSNLSKDKACLVNDGDVSTAWSGQFYPSYVDIDLMEAYDLSDVQISLPAGKIVRYTLYGSLDGENYTRIAEKADDEKAGDTPFVHPLESVQARILRVYLEYTEKEDSAWLSEVRVHGTKAETEAVIDRTKNIFDMLDIEKWSDTDYAAPITEEETIENVYGIIERILGAEYRDWFAFELSPEKDETGKDWFEISEKDGKTCIRGNEGLSLTRGLNEYFKQFLHVNVSEQTVQIPENLQRVPVPSAVYKETDMGVRYAFNYCTISYSFAFYGEEEWQRENDWLALSGANVVLDLAGQEAVWIEFLMNFGYSFDDAKDWLTGPAYYAWQFMDNMETFGGPIPDGYVKDRLEMARKNQRWKNSLGMQTVIQGYAGMVPTNFTLFQPDVTVIEQGGWNGFSRPSMIATDGELYDQYAQLFYQAQEDMLGNRNHYYAVDPFHEGGKRPAGLGDETISREVLESMTAHDEQAVWVVQGWQSNPTNALLKGMEGYRDEHVLIVDLIKYPIKDWTKFDRTSYGSTKLDDTEFNKTPWAWCLLSNFGGNPSMHGEMETMVQSILNARKNSEKMAGIGIISEAANDNPVLYDLVFDLAWAGEDFSLEDWLEDYLVRRYSMKDYSLMSAWKLLQDSLYDYGVRFTPEVFGTKNKAPQSYGKQNIGYDPEILEKAITLMMKDYDQLAEKETYRYDLSEMLRQQVSNYAVLTYNQLLDAVSAKDLETFRTCKASFLNALDVLAAVESTQQDQLGGEWIGKAEDRAAGYDDFTRDAFVMNAKALITSWGSYAGHRSLKDYGWRNYEGIFQDVYGSVWSEYLDRVEANLATGAPLNNRSVSDYFAQYWKWNLAEQSYSRQAVEDPAAYKEIALRVLSECSVQGTKDENTGNLALYSLLQAEHQDQDALQPLADGDVQTGVTLQKPVTLHLIAQLALSSVQIVPAAESADPADWSVQISADGENWSDLALQSTENGLQGTVESGTWQFVRVNAAGQEAAEIRVYGERILPTLEQLQQLCDVAETLPVQTSSEAALKVFRSALQDARTALEQSAAPDETDFRYWALYDAITALNFSSLSNMALGRPVQAHNDPAGHSERLTDGNVSTRWDAGRLSATGKPYETTITPGYAVVDLEQVVQIREITPFFTANAWHHFTLSVSLDGQTWTEVHSKTDSALPDSEKDSAALDDVLARYVRLDLLNVAEGSDGKRVPIGVSELNVLGKAYVPDVRSLQQAIDAALALDAGRYTTQSWETLQSALQAAQALLEETQPLPQALSEAETALQAALDALEEVSQETVDKTLLQAAVLYAQSLEEQGALEGVNALVASFFQQSLETAKAVLADPQADAGQVQQAWKDLVQAIHMLEFKSDFSRLDALMAQAQAIADADPDGAAAAGLSEALAQAKEVRESQTALNEQSIAAAEAALEEALAAYARLQQIDTSLLELLVQTVEETDLSRYTEEGQEALQAALENARDVLAQPENQEQVNEAASSLHSAWLALRLKADESLLAQLQNFVQRVSVLQLDESDPAAEPLFSVYAQICLHLQNPESLTQETALEDCAAAEAILPLLEELEKARKEDGFGQNSLQTPDSMKPGQSVQTVPSVSGPGAEKQKAHADSVRTAVRLGAPAILTGAAAAVLGALVLRRRQNRK